MNFSRQIIEKYSKIKFNEICPVGAESFSVDGQTDMTKLIVAFRSFTNTPENQHFIPLQNFNPLTPELFFF